ncbi:hypothetical protein ACVWWO_009523 [Bradyrhizobium sp. F1.13.1]
MFAYALNPIDHWTGWMTEAQFLAQIRAGYMPVDEAGYFAAKNRALDLARSAGWEGDVRQGPFIAGMPSGDERHFLIGWKQDNNGTTYIVSPYRLPWIEADGADPVRG